jgi:2,4-diketo-3-deoxy-L-fuconate hydrolase
MRLCRYRFDEQITVGFYDERGIIPLGNAFAIYTETERTTLHLPDSVNLLDYLPPDGAGYSAAKSLADWITAASPATARLQRLAPSQLELLVPVPRPNKLFLLAGNYAKHIEEGGGKAAERAETFPYVFMKPPTTTLTDPGKPVLIPQVSPNSIDWELELAVVIGRRCKSVSEASALSYVAGYTVINDISNRRFKPNPNRKPRDRDAFFDWLHGKWHDTFCPCGPCILGAEQLPDPQNLKLRLSVNGEVKQDASTSQMVFPVAAVIEFIASFVTLEPGDIISTGTPEGVGHAKGTYLKSGDQIEASIERIGQLTTPVQNEA